MEKLDPTKEYHFNVVFAVKFGVPEAVLIQNLKFWITKNRANQSESHYHEGRWWTYNSVKAFRELFPMWTEKQIYRALNSLETQEVIITNNFNKESINHTKWYAFRDESIFLDGEIPRDWTNLPIGKIEFTYRENRIYPEGKSIIKTYNKPTYKNPISKEIEGDSDESPFGIPSGDIYYPYLKELKGILSRGKFGTRTDRKSKVLDKTYEYIESLRKGKFLELQFDKSWISKNDIDLTPISKLKGSSIPDIIKFLNRPITRFGKMKTDPEVWPTDKESLKSTGLDIFFYNPRTQKSWFLYCLSNIPSSSIGVLPKVEFEKLKENYPGIETSWENLYNKTETRKWSAVEWSQFFGCMRSIESWWKNNFNDLEVVNSGWATVGRSFQTFTRIIFDYLSEFWSGDLRPYFLPLSGNRWNGLRQNIRNLYGVELDPEPEEIKKAKDRLILAKKKETEKRIEEEMKKLQHTFSELNYPSMDYEDLRRAAMESLHLEAV